MNKYLNFSHNSLMVETPNKIHSKKCGVLFGGSCQTSLSGICVEISFVLFSPVATAKQVIVMDASTIATNPAADMAAINGNSIIKNICQNYNKKSVFAIDKNKIVRYSTQQKKSY